LWLDYPNRVAIQQATAQIDRELAQAPKLYGTAYHEGLWTISAGPLTAFYSISDDDRLVEVGGLCLNPRVAE
jgi:hypothetical protein